MHALGYAALAIGLYICLIKVFFPRVAIEVISLCHQCGKDHPTWSDCPLCNECEKVQ